MRKRLLAYLVFATAVIGIAVARADTQPASAAHAATPAVDWTKVSGNVRAVSAEDIVQAIEAFQRIGIKASALEVVSQTEIHGYGDNRDLGWYTAKRFIVVGPDKSQHSQWDASGKGLPEYTKALECMWNADQVYVFPVATPLEPHRDDAHLKLVEGWPRRQLVQLLGDADHWFQGFNDLMYTNEGPSVGFLFRNKKHELVLFLMHPDVLVGTYDGEDLSGTLDDASDHRWERELDEWITKNGQPTK